MRYILYGVGAVGGVVAAALSEAGHDVVGIARGARLEALQANGLAFRSANRSRRYRLDLRADPSEIDIRSDDAILLLMKSQHTAAALAALRDAGVDEQPIFCCQNGVANERAALRLFPNVHAVTVMLPAQFEALDEAVACCAPEYGAFDIGRAPSGADDHDRVLAEALTPGGIRGYVDPDVMVSKYGKLILNLGNVVEAAVGRGAKTGPVAEVLRDEAKRVLDAAGILWRDVGHDDPRRDLMRPAEVEGVTRSGSSSTQSLARGAGSIETDYLNGEIVLLARLHGVPAPANAAMCRLAARLVRDGANPGSVPAAEVHEMVGLPPP